MGQLHTIENELQKLGYQILAVAPDRPEALAESRGKHEFKYQLLSDSKMSAARAFGIAFQVDAKTAERYKGYGIDLVKASGESHQQLPVPALFLVGTDGIVDFQYVNPDYSVRVSADVVVAAAKSIQAEDKKSDS